MVERIRRWSWVCWVNASYKSLFDSSNHDLDVFFSKKHRQQCYKNDRTTTVALTRVEDCLFVIKRYNARSQWHTLKRALRRSRARRCWQMSLCFQQAGLNVAQPILMKEKRWGPFCGDAYFINEHINGVTLLDQLVNMSVGEQQDVKEAVAEAFSLMEQALLTHGDLKASNLIWYQRKLYFIDLDAAMRHKLMLAWRYSHNKDLKRFMRNWQSQPALEALFADLRSSV